MAPERRQRRYPNLLAGGKKKPRRKQTAPGRPFTKGDPRAGRPKGVPNKVTREAKALAKSIIEDAEYQGRLLRDARRGKLAPPIEAQLWHYAYGKPKEHVAVEGGLEALIVRIVDDARAARESDPDASDS